MIWTGDWQKGDKYRIYPKEYFLKTYNNETNCYEIAGLQFSEDILDKYAGKVLTLYGKHCDYYFSMGDENNDIIKSDDGRIVLWDKCMFEELIDRDWETYNARNEYNKCVADPQYFYKKYYTKK